MTTTKARGRKPHQGMAFRRVNHAPPGRGGEWVLERWYPTPNAQKFVGYATVHGERCALYLSTGHELHAQIV